MKNIFLLKLLSVLLLFQLTFAEVNLEKTLTSDKIDHDKTMNLILEAFKYYQLDCKSLEINIKHEPKYNFSGWSDDKGLVINTASKGYKNFNYRVWVIYHECGHLKDFSFNEYPWILVDELEKQGINSGHNKIYRDCEHRANINAINALLEKNEFDAINAKLNRLFYYQVHKGKNHRCYELHPTCGEQIKVFKRLLKAQGYKIACYVENKIIKTEIYKDNQILSEMKYI